MTEREEALQAANNIPLDELAEKVIRGSYISGIDDAVLLERIKVLMVLVRGGLL